MYLVFTIVATIWKQKEATGITEVRKKINVISESIGSVSIKAQADIWNELGAFIFFTRFTAPYS
jgi:hypothetical protein